MAVDSGKDPPPDTYVNEDDRSQNGSVASWDTCGKNRGSSKIKQVDFTVTKSLHASAFMKGLIEQLRLVDPTAALVPL